MGELVHRIIGNLEQRRQRVLNGEINCIPSPLSRFRCDFPGVEQGKFYLVSGSSKGGKTQITSFLFLFNSVLYAYQHPEKADLTVFYFPLEETPEAITLRFMSFLLYILSGGKLVVSSTDLKSVDERNPLDESVLKELNSERYQRILDFFETHVHFYQEKNPTGIFLKVKSYAEQHGTTHYKEMKFNRDNGKEETAQVFDYYVPDNPNEYVLIITDHVSLLSTERGGSLKEAIDTFSTYMVTLRNRYNYTPIVVQQQNIETIGLDAFKANKIRPTLAGLGDTQNTGKDCTVMLGITNPFAFEIPTWDKYDITRLRDSARFLEIVLNREGQSNCRVGLYFNGASNYFEELPPPNDKERLNAIYNRIDALEKEKLSICCISYCSPNNKDTRERNGKRKYNTWYYRYRKKHKHSWTGSQRNSYN